MILIPVGTGVVRYAAIEGPLGRQRVLEPERQVVTVLIEPLLRGGAVKDGDFVVVVAAPVLPAQIAHDGPVVGQSMKGAHHQLLGAVDHAGQGQGGADAGQVGAREGDGAVDGEVVGHLAGIAEPESGLWIVLIEEPQLGIEGPVSVVLLLLPATALPGEGEQAVVDADPGPE